MFTFATLPLGFIYYLLRTQAKHIRYIIYTEYAFTIHVNPKYLHNVLHFLTHSFFCQQTILTELTAIDNYFRCERFYLVAVLTSPVFATRIQVTTDFNEITEVMSLTPFFLSAGWQEREIWDMYGIFFKGNPDMRRILTDYGFVGYPLRKDFPMTGYQEMLFLDRKQQLNQIPVSLVQEFRLLNRSRVWVE